MAPQASSVQLGAMATQLLFFLRFIQQGSLILGGFVAAYFVHWHILLHDPVPTQLIILIAACTISVLESYITSAISLQREGPNYTRLIKSSAPCSLFLGIGYYALRTVPFVRKWCEGDNWFKPIRETEGYTLAPAGVEEHHCALTCVIIVAGAVALAATVLVSALGVTGAVMEMKRGVHAPRGYAMVGEMMDDYDDNKTCVEEDFDT